MTDIELRPGVKILLFDRSDGPYFALREFDTKILRANTSKKNALRVHGASEQAIRARITQVIMKMKLNALKGHKNEIDVLKKRGILGKRAPKCSMLNTTDTIRLLKAFGCDSYAEDLEALMRERGVTVNIPEETYPDEAQHHGVVDDDEGSASPSEQEQSTPKIRPEDPSRHGPKAVKRLLQFSSSPSRHVPKRAKIDKISREHAHRGSIAHGAFLWNGVRVQGEEGMMPLILPQPHMSLAREASPRPSDQGAPQAYHLADPGSAASAAHPTWTSTTASGLVCPPLVPRGQFPVAGAMPNTPLDAGPILQASASTQDFPRDTSYFLLSPELPTGADSSSEVTSSMLGTASSSANDHDGNSSSSTATTTVREGWLFD